jgi:uncharacterized membrane protein
MANRNMTFANPLVLFLLIGLFVGAIAGYFTRPNSAEIRVGPVSIEVTGNQVARDNGPLTGSQMRYIATVTLIGGIIGLGLGYAIKSGKLKV